MEEVEDDAYVIDSKGNSDIEEESDESNDILIIY